MKTDEQLDRQISEEFEKWIKGMDFHCQWKAENHLISLDAYFNYVAEVAFKAAVLPLMKKIEEMERQITEWKKVKDVFLAEVRKLQKENEELREALEWWTKNYATTDIVPKRCLSLEHIEKFNLDKEGGK